MKDKISSNYIVIYRKIAVIFLILFFPMFGFGQIEANFSNEIYMGKIPVYKFRIDTLEYQNDRKELSAIGTAFVAELYSSKIGDNWVMGTGT